MANDEATRIDAAASVEGRLTGRNAEILGRFKGEVKLEGRLVVGAGARLEADVDAGIAEIAGHFHGELRAGQLLLRDSAQVEGSVHAKVLSIQEGAVINGAVNSGDAATPKTSSPAATQKVETLGEAGPPGASEAKPDIAKGGGSGGGKPTGGGSA